MIAARSLSDFRYVLIGSFSDKSTPLQGTNEEADCGNEDISGKDGAIPRSPGSKPRRYFLVPRKPARSREFR